MTIPEWPAVAALIVAVVNLVALGFYIFKSGRWAGTVDTKLDHFTAKLGNGTPGQVVLMPECRRLHDSVERALGEVRSDIRELREAVLNK